MKKFIILILASFLILFVSSVGAQPKQIKLGFQGGLNFTNLSIDPTPQGADLGMRTAFLFGGIFNYGFSPMLSLQVEPAFIQRGSSLDATTNEGGATQKFESTITVNYLDIPVLVKASFKAGKVKPFLLAGVSAAFLLGDVKWKVDKATNNGQDVTSQLPSNQKEQTKKGKSTDFLLNFGGGIMIPVGKADIFIEGQYNLGLTNINDESNDTSTIKNSGIQVKAGALFSL